MATPKQQSDFIQAIAPIVIKYAKQFGYKNVSGTIAQACLESAYGTCGLSKYFNFFGMKCGGAWKGPSVNMRTMEEYTVGTLTAISDNFRVYKDMDSGVKGYYEFLNWSRYAAVKNQTTAESFLTAIKAAGYATSSAYVKNCMSVVNAHNLTAWDAVFAGDNVTVAPAAGQIENIPNYIVGKVYVLDVELNVRTDAGTWSRKKTHAELTPNAKANDRDFDGAIDKGTKVSCLEVKKDGSDVWIRIPSGWVAAYWKGNTYIKAA